MTDGAVLRSWADVVNYLQRNESNYGCEQWPWVRLASAYITHNLLLAGSQRVFSRAMRKVARMSRVPSPNQDSLRQLDDILVGASERIASYYHMVDSFAQRFPRVDRYHRRFVVARERAVYELLDDLSTLVSSLIGDDGDMVTGDELLARLG